MEHLNNTIFRKFSQLKYVDRQNIERLVKQGESVASIVRMLGKHRTTIIRELQLGKVETKFLVPDSIAVIGHMQRQYKTRVEYSADAAEMKHRFNAQAKGCHDKLGANHSFAKAIAALIKQKYSPAAALEILRKTQPSVYINISVKTLYNYIDRDLIAGVTNKDLWVKRCKKKHVYNTIRHSYRRKSGKSIEERGEEANNRNELGHWEMDLIVGKQGTKAALLTLTERQSRYEIAVKISNKKQETIAVAIDSLERKYGCKFKEIFKTITCDNGTEFLNTESLEKSCITNGRRTEIYYAHPYSSWERGSNEVGNKFIRRFIKKGTDIAKWSKNELDKIIDWINNYPRKILGWQSSNELFNWGR